MPNSASVAATMASTDSVSRMSATIVMQRPPASVISAAVRARLSGFRAAIATDAPRRAMASAVIRPMPRPPPVISATRPPSSSGANVERGGLTRSLTRGNLSNDQFPRRSPTIAAVTHPGELFDVQYRLTKMDEWPRHQVGGTFDVVADGSPHWSDGYYFTMGDDTGEIAWFMGFRLHANNDVLDAFTCISSRGRQHNIRWSRRLRPRIDDLDCGPFSVEILEGLRTVRTRCSQNNHGITFDLLWEGFSPPYNEDRLISIINGRLHSDRSNYDQCSLVTGWIGFDGRRVEVDRWTGVRDHSWGACSRAVRTALRTWPSSARRCIRCSFAVSPNWLRRRHEHRDAHEREPEHDLSTYQLQGVP